MQLSQLPRKDILTRPPENKRNIEDGVYNGTIASVELVEWPSEFSDDGLRVVLNIRIEVEDDCGNIVDLYHAPNYSWSKKGKMVQTLKKLDVLPQPGESLRLERLVGIQVQVRVRNVRRDGRIFSNVIDIKRS